MVHAVRSATEPHPQPLSVFCYSNWSEMISHSNFDMHFLVINDAEHFFTYLLVTSLVLYK